jgi:hypothetical protein
MPLDQQQAVLAATGDPSRWLTVEIEVTVDGEGKVSARVAFPSGRRALDRYALAIVQEEVARNPVPATVSRWVCKAGYAVSQPTSVSLTFDETMLFDKSLRKRLAVQYPMKERVDVNVALKWVRPQR